MRRQDARRRAPASRARPASGRAPMSNSTSDMLTIRPRAVSRVSRITLSCCRSCSRSCAFSCSDWAALPCACCGLRLRVARAARPPRARSPPSARAASASALRRSAGVLLGSAAALRSRGRLAASAARRPRARPPRSARRAPPGAAAPFGRRGRRASCSRGRGARSLLGEERLFLPLQAR